MTIRIGGQIWTPPPGMLPSVRSEWASFYRKAWNEYGTTPTQYRDLYLAQHGRCYICQIAKGKHPDDPRGGGGRRLGIDHNHLSSNVRALLCTGSTSANTCNRLIGRYNADQLRRAVEVLTQEPAQVVLQAGRDFDAGHYEGHQRDTVMNRILRVAQRHLRNVS